MAHPGTVTISVLNGLNIEQFCWHAHCH